MFAMRDFATCYNEYAVQVSDTSCSVDPNISCVSPSLSPSTQNAVICLYRTTLSSKKNIDMRVTWCKNTVGQGLSIHFGDDPSSPFKLNTSSRPFRKKKGTKLFEHKDSRIEVFWDLSAARYHLGPEPIDGYYVFVSVDSEIVLILGDLAEESSSFKKLRNGIPEAEFLLISRQEHFSGNTLYSTKAQFCDAGTAHDIMIRCSGAKEGFRHQVLSVCIDNKVVIRVKRLQWNFRGNQTIFVDGLLVDLLWDVHDWFFNPASGSAVFMFRTRSGMESRLWLQDKDVHKDQAKFEFSLLIYACRCP